MAYTGRSPQSALKQKFYASVAGARTRKVPFRLTYEQWLWLWERALGPDWVRMKGSHRGQYCMARFGDRGPYEIGNVVIKLATEKVCAAKSKRDNFSELNGVLCLPT